MEEERENALAEKSSIAPLPLKVPEIVMCPKCGQERNVLLGKNQGETAWVTCHGCTIRYAVHRYIDGTLKIGGLFKKKSQEKKYAVLVVTILLH